MMCCCTFGVKEIQTTQASNVFCNFVCSRSHMAFIEDVLDAHIVAAAMEHYGLESVDSLHPVKNPLPADLPTWTTDNQMNYLLGCAEKLMEGFCCDKDEQSQNSLQQLEEDLTAMDEIERKIQRWKFDGVYHCPEVCDKKYKTEGWLKHHLREKHNWTIPELGRHSRQGKASHQAGSSRDVRGAFMRAAMLMRSTYKAYKTGDGDRIFRNAKFEFLYAFALKHTKYRLWLFYMLAYEKAILSPRQAFTYKWNCCSNLQGQPDTCIPNDNLVELQVGNVKKQLKAQGANVTYSSARDASKVTQVVHELKDRVSETLNLHKGSGTHKEVDKTEDILEMAQELVDSNYMSSDGIMLTCFKDFKDVVASIQSQKVHEWLTQYKVKASRL